MESDESAEDQYYIQEIEPDTEARWTTDPGEAADEALPYMPPVDPPVLPSADQGADVAAGFAVSAEDAPFRPDVPTDDAWIAQEVTRVLREDSATSKLPLRVVVANGTVYLHGFVSDEADIELATTVASRVPGVEWVEDRTEVNPDEVDFSE